MSETELDFPTAAELSVKAFGAENRVLIGVEVRMAERQADGTIRVHKARWGWDDATYKSGDEINRSEPKTNRA